MNIGAPFNPYRVFQDTWERSRLTGCSNTEGSVPVRSFVTFDCSVLPAKTPAATLRSKHWGRASVFLSVKRGTTSRNWNAAG